MEPTMRRKEHEYIDHTLLAPEYMRDPNHFIIDLMEHPGVFVHSKKIETNNVPEYCEKDDLNFHNTYFQFVNKDVHTNDDSIEHTPRSPALIDRESNVEHVHHHYVDKHTNDFLTLNSSFLGEPHTPETQVDNTVPTYSALAIEPTVPIHDTSAYHDDFIYAPNTRKVLPHKKRISRKLRGSISGIDIAAFTDEIEPQKRMLYNCEICGLSTGTQIDFFSHLKQHYEPPPPHTIIASMRTTLEALDADENDCCEDMMNSKEAAHTAAEQAKLDQVFQHVQIDFEDFHKLTHDQVDVDDVMDPNTSIQHSNSVDDSFVEEDDDETLKNVVDSAAAAADIVDEVEFSDTEDMLEGIRNVVDKVSIEDTCDEIDLMASSAIRGPWFSTNNFSDILFKSCDDAFARQLGHILLDAEAPPPSIAEPIKSSTELPQIEAIRTQEKLLPYLEPPDEETISLPASPIENSEYQPMYSELNANCDKQLLTDQSVLSRDDQIYEPLTPAATQTEFALTKERHVSSRQREYRRPPITTEQTGIKTTTVRHRSSSRIAEKCTDTDEQITIDTTATVANVLNDEEYVDDDAYNSEYDDSESTKADNKKQHICLKCGRQFNSGNALKYHDTTHTQVRPHQCDICGKKFFAISALKTHLRTHSGEKPFECEHCHRKFRQWGDLQYHFVSIHSEVKSHMCEFCGKAFSRKYSLVLHRRIHTSERNYKCEYCEKTFRASSYLNVHLKIHTGEKPYSCDICNKKFRVTSDMRRHQRIHKK